MSGGPTVLEMIDWLKRFDYTSGYMPEAICAILEQYSEKRKVELAAIRAFVERVEERLPGYNTGKGADSWLKAYRLAVYGELAAMEGGKT